MRREPNMPALTSKANVFVINQQKKKGAKKKPTEFEKAVFDSEPQPTDEYPPFYFIEVDTGGNRALETLNAFNDGQIKCVIIEVPKSAEEKYEVAELARAIEENIPVIFLNGRNGHAGFPVEQLVCGPRKIVKEIIKILNDKPKKEQVMAAPNLAVPTTLF